MSNNVHRHEAYEILYESGSVSYVSYTTPESVNSECVIPAPVKYVVPIIFIPGIMGQILKIPLMIKRFGIPEYHCLQLLNTVNEMHENDRLP